MRLSLSVALAFVASLTVPLAGQEADTYTIGPKDLLDIRVYEAPNLNSERRVAATGRISFPPLGDVSVEGLTVGQLEQEMKRLLEQRFLQRATVTVQVREFRSKPISVIGAVQRPGDLGFSGRWTLLEALTAAGGLAENHGGVVYVLRRADNGLSAQIEIPVHDLMVRADPSVNIPIFANDLINVSTTVELTVYCLGEVARPGALEFKSTERLSLLAAIARAGGLSDRASQKILIKRGTGEGGAAEEWTVDYRHIVDGREADPPLRDGDIIVVKESFF